MESDFGDCSGGRCGVAVRGARFQADAGDEPGGAQSA
jgi:hypothetical protein